MSRKISTLFAVPLFLSSALAMDEDKQKTPSNITKSNSTTLKFSVKKNNPVIQNTQLDQAAIVLPAQNSVLQIEQAAETDYVKSRSTDNGKIFATNKKRSRNNNESSDENGMEYNSKKQKSNSFENSDFLISNEIIQDVNDSESDDSRPDFYDENNNNNNNNNNQFEKEEFEINIEGDKIELPDSDITEEKNVVEVFSELENKEIDFFKDVVKYFGIENWDVDFKRERIIILFNHKKSYMPKFSDITKINGLKDFYYKILCEESFDDCFPNKILQVEKKKMKYLDDSVKDIIHASTAVNHEYFEKYMEGFTCRVVCLRLFKELCDRNYKIYIGTHEYPANKSQAVPGLSSSLANFVHSASSAKKGSKTFTDGSLKKAMQKYIDIIEDEPEINGMDQSESTGVIQRYSYQQQSFSAFVGQFPPQQQQQQQQAMPQLHPTQQQLYQMPPMQPTQQQQQYVMPQFQQMQPQPQQQQQLQQQLQQQNQRELSPAKQKIQEQQMQINQFVDLLKKKNAEIVVLKKVLETYKSAEQKPMDENVQMMYS